MNQDLLNSTAEVLEKAAAYMDAIETEHHDAVVAERSKIANALKTRYEEVTGDSLDEGIVSKLASSDADIVNLIEKLAGSVQAPDSMGGPGNKQDERIPRSTKEAADVAEDRFAAWLSNS